MAYTVVTGATGGLGKQLAYQAAQTGQDLVLTATHADALTQQQQIIEQTYHVHVYTLACDLSDANAGVTIHDFTASHGLDVTELINCAGFGSWTRFLDAPWSAINAMMMVNMHALTQLTYLYGNDMKAKHQGRILNISSLASRMPGPYMALYFATKAYVTSLGVALAYELRGSGVHCTTICPGPITTGFEKKAAMHGKNFFTMMHPATAEQAARFAYRRMRAGKTLAFQGAGAKLGAFWARIMPTRIMTAIAATMNGGDPTHGADASATSTPSTTTASSSTPHNTAA
ncbi:SDR family NAD(P)-dependent oxidoreductase [Bifidobacterium gallicum]|uniref:Oxidoreductase, short chain dehydrogenase/reductase family protein n=1 Tax=Bifidobacterium gallicum DSM 20093 = LMG 11596 TaxID=561180 RepID=D1NS21_9BIFI|nr:SDR family NAD(P)-dependent oxidoreductase [Bifidobacterium gallicum]EFA23473.1 oxidoreductase, short chain dehydrogenase/reductase family protein [Bifidobacterium gallicum DSM 20093 = LMG 11596]KFI57240.1 short-chain dehydrogenase [Bifidobacterium gallicum DSM 20093 = LMG 11596]